MNQFSSLARAPSLVDPLTDKSTKWYIHQDLAITSVCNMSSRHTPVCNMSLRRTPTDMKPNLTDDQKAKRLEFAKTQMDWLENRWMSMLFSENPSLHHLPCHSLCCWGNMALEGKKDHQAGDVTVTHEEGSGEGFQAVSKGTEEQAAQSPGQESPHHPGCSLQSWVFIAKKPFLNKWMKQKRLAFTEKHADWSVNKWKKVLFSDELFTNNRFKRVQLCQCFDCAGCSDCSGVLTVIKAHGMMAKYY